MRTMMLALTALTGCNLVFGVDEPELVHGAGGASGATSSASQSANTTGQGGSGQGGATTVGSGGQGGSGPCAQRADPATCYSCCAQESAEGETVFQTAFLGCGCDAMNGGCQTPCGSSLCNSGGTAMKPDGPCVECIVMTLSASGNCAQDPTFIQNCTDASPCSAFKACLLECGS